MSGAIVTAVAALAPVFGVIALGVALKRFQVVPDTIWAPVNTFGYRVFYPAFLFATIAGADFQGPATVRFLAGVLLGFALLAGLLLALRRVLGPDGPAFTSVFQGGLRWHGFIILAAAPGLFGAEGEALVALAFGPVVAFVNVVCVAVLSRWGEPAADAPRQNPLRELIANPLILGSLSGILASVTGLAGLMGPALDTLQIVGRAAMPVALLCVGAALTLDGLSSRRVHLGAGLLAKLALAPACLLVAAGLAGLSPLETAVAVGIGCTPTAAASYMLAREMGGDARLMAALVTATTIAAAITMPLWLGMITPGG